MKTIRLVSFRDEMTGEIGLGLQGVARHEQLNAAMDGLTIAHDLIEHVNGPELIGTIDDELEALGAIWYVRGQYGELRRDNLGSRYSIEENIASDVVRMYRDHIDGAQHVSYNVSGRGRKCEADHNLENILVCADESYLGEFDADGKKAARDGWQAYRLVCLARMRIGYCKAKRKWEKRGRFAANTQFWAITEAVDRVVKDIEYEGQEFTLRYGNGDASCEEYYGGDYE